MGRSSNTTRSGQPFDQVAIDAVWTKGAVVPGIDPSRRRKDPCGAWIDYQNYGRTVDDGTGWEIDHIVPVAKGGGDLLSNLQPLQWQNNRHKSDNYPNWSCLIRAA